MMTISKLPLQLLGLSLSILSYILIVLYGPIPLFRIFLLGLKLANTYFEPWNVLTYLVALFFLYISTAILVIKIYDCFIDRFQKALSIFLYSSLLWAMPIGVWRILVYIAQRSFL